MEDFMNLNKETMIKFEEIEKRIHSVNKKATANSEAISSLSENLTTAPDGYDFLNLFSMNKAYYRKRAIGNCMANRVYFLCDTDTPVKIRVVANIVLHVHSGGPYSAKFVTQLNKENATDADGKFLFRKFIEYNETTEYTLTFEDLINPTENHNFLSFYLDSGANDATKCSAEITSVIFEIYGRNIVVLNRPHDFKVFISKNNYYITKSSADGEFYSKIPIDNVSLNNFAAIPNLVPKNVPLYDDRFFPFSFTYIPKIFYNAASQKYEVDHSVDLFIFGVAHLSRIVSGESFFTDGAASLITLSDLYGHNYYVGHPIQNGLYPQTLTIVNTNEPYMKDFPRRLFTNGTTSSNSRLKIDGKFTTEAFPDIWPVFAKNWEDDPNRPFLMVAMNEFGDLYLIPEINPTYTVHLGKGRHANAYIQEDDSIVVYFNWFNKTYKRTLILNTETNQYELTDEITIFKNVSEIIEGYSTGYFVADMARNWEYHESLDEFLIS